MQTEPSSKPGQSDINSVLDPDHMAQYFSFIVNDQEYGVDILRVQEIRGWTGVRVMPDMPRYIKGVIDLRGMIVPIIDLRQCFGSKRFDYSNTTVVVILKVCTETSEKIMGIVVDAVSDVIDVTQANSQPAPDFGESAEVDFVKKLVSIDNKMVVLIDIDDLLGDNLGKYAEFGCQQSSDAEDDHLEEEALLEDSVLNIDVLEQTFNEVAPNGDKFVRHFYAELFKQFPDVVPMFENTTVAEQEKKLLAALQLVVGNLRNPEKLTSALQTLGKKHQGFGAVAAHYDAVAEIMLQSLEQFSGQSWSKQAAAAWASALTTIKDQMMSAYQPSVDTLNVALLESSFEMLVPKIEELVARFYQRLFEKFPEVRSLFSSTTTHDQGKKLIAALQLTMNNLTHPEALKAALSELGKKHQAYGAESAHYDAVAVTLLEVMADFAGEHWTPDINNAWADALSVVKTAMLSAYVDE